MDEAEEKKIRKNRTHIVRIHEIEDMYGRKPTAYEIRALHELPLSAEGLYDISANGRRIRELLVLSEQNRDPSFLDEAGALMTYQAMRNPYSNGSEPPFEYSEKKHKAVSSLAADPQHHPSPSVSINPSLKLPLICPMLQLRATKNPSAASSSSNNTFSGTSQTSQFDGSKIQSIGHSQDVSASQSRYERLLLPQTGSNKDQLPGQQPPFGQSAMQPLNGLRTLQSQTSDLPLGNSMLNSADIQRGGQPMGNYPVISHPGQTSQYLDSMVVQNPFRDRSSNNSSSATRSWTVDPVVSSTQHQVPGSSELWKKRTQDAGAEEYAAAKSSKLDLVV